jgi:hypothetical protein
MVDGRQRRWGGEDEKQTESTASIQKCLEME